MCITWCISNISAFSGLKHCGYLFCTFLHFSLAFDPFCATYTNALFTPLLLPIIQLFINNPNYYKIVLLSLRSAVTKKAAPIRSHPIILSLENSTNCKNLLVIRIRDNNTCLAGTCMYNLSVTDINCHMAGITNQIAGLSIGKTIYCISLCSV